VVVRGGTFIITALNMTIVSDLCVEDDWCVPDRYSWEQIYEQATALLARIIDNNADSNATNKVKELNRKLLAHNMKEKLSVE
jgi:hypothetical protein